MKLWKPNYCNCLLWALVQQWRHGGKIKARKSLFGNYRHYLWSNDNHHWYGYTPVKNRLPIFDTLRLPPPFFRGKVVQEKWLHQRPHKREHLEIIEL